MVIKIGKIFSIFKRKVKKNKSIKKENKVHKNTFSEIVKKEKREHAMMIGLTAAIVILLIFFGYSMYTFYKTKTVTTSQIYSLNGSINNLSAEKYQLTLNNSNLTLQITSLNGIVTGLNNQKASLISEKSALREENDNLTSTLDNLQADYDSLNDDLNSCQSDLDDCEAAA